MGNFNPCGKNTAATALSMAGRRLMKKVVLAPCYLAVLGSRVIVKFRSQRTVQTLPQGTALGTGRNWGKKETFLTVAVPLINRRKSEGGDGNLLPPPSPSPAVYARPEISFSFPSQVATAIHLARAAVAPCETFNDMKKPLLPLISVQGKMYNNGSGSGDHVHSLEKKKVLPPPLSCTTK